jgi:hypothetical protein
VVRPSRGACVALAARAPRDRAAHGIRRRRRAVDAALEQAVLPRARFRGIIERAVLPGKPGDGIPPSCRKPVAALGGKRMRTFDEEIARHLQEAAESGELRQARGYGRPTPEDSGWDATPAALRMPMKILKDAGAAPPEVALFHERARLRTALSAATGDADERAGLQCKLNDLEQQISLRLEMLRIHSTTP